MNANIQAQTAQIQMTVGMSESKAHRVAQYMRKRGMNFNSPAAVCDAIIGLQSKRKERVKEDKAPRTQAQKVAGALKSGRLKRVVRSDIDELMNAYGCCENEAIECLL